MYYLFVVFSQTDTGARSVNPEKISKAMLLDAFKSSKSPVIQNAISEWNAFNKVVRSLVRSTAVSQLSACTQIMLRILLSSRHNTRCNCSYNPCVYISLV